MAHANQHEFNPTPQSVPSATSLGGAGVGGPLPHALAWFGRNVKGLASSVGQRYLERLSGGQGSVRDSLEAVPDRIQRTAQQTRLVLELLDDVRSGAYREVRWYSLPVAAAALLYAVSPTDVVPDILPFVGVLDDVAVMATALRVLRGELRAYCRFKGYPEDQYFDVSA